MFTAKTICVQAFNDTSAFLSTNINNSISNTINTELGINASIKKVKFDQEEKIDIAALM